MIGKMWLKREMIKRGFKFDDRERIVRRLRSIEEQLDTMIHTTQINEIRADRGLPVLNEGETV